MNAVAEAPARNYTSRVLPIEEWHRLKGTEAERLWPQLDPERTSIVVVEQDGRIVGCHVLSWLLHAECLWIAPELRGRTGVGRRLWDAVKREAKTVWGAHAVITGAIDDKVRVLLAHVEAKKLPGDQYRIDLKD